MTAKHSSNPRCNQAFVRRDYNSSVDFRTLDPRFARFLTCLWPEALLINQWKSRTGLAGRVVSTLALHSV